MAKWLITLILEKKTSFLDDDEDIKSRTRKALELEFSGIDDEGQIMKGEEAKVIKIQVGRLEVDSDGVN